MATSKRSPRFRSVDTHSVAGGGPEPLELIKLPTPVWLMFYVVRFPFKHRIFGLIIVASILALVFKTNFFLVLGIALTLSISFLYLYTWSRYSYAPTMKRLTMAIRRRWHTHKRWPQAMKAIGIKSLPKLFNVKYTPNGIVAWLMTDQGHDSEFVKSKSVEIAAVLQANEVKVDANVPFQAQISIIWGDPTERILFPEDLSEIQPSDNDLVAFALDADHSPLSVFITTSLLIVGESESGKGHPLDTLICTPDGWEKIGNLKKGSYVIGSNGLPTEVLDVYDRGQLDTYEVEFNDGSTTTCDGDHLWRVEEIGHKKWETKSTRQLANKWWMGSDKNHAKYRIPLTKPVQFNKKALPVEPYLMGCFLANGYLINTPVISTNDEEIIDNIKSLDPKLPIREIYEGTSRRWAISLFGRNFLEPLGLLGVKSREKFIPGIYFTADVDSRKLLLAGLLDCDGSIANPQTIAQPSFHSRSKQLVEGVTYLVESLGGTVNVWKYKDLDYSVNIILPFNPFMLSRKANIIDRAEKSRSNVKRLNRRISNITKMNKQEIRCIRVAANDNLYVTERFVVTHNSNCFWSILNGLNEKQTPYKLWVIDPAGGVELDALQNSPNTLGYVQSPGQADDLITQALDSMNTRLNSMKLRGARKYDISEAEPLNIVVVDELLLLPNYNQYSSLGHILSSGRKAGYIVIALSQLSQIDALGRNRDLFPQRICHATKSPDMTDAALGMGAEQAGALCSKISKRTPGVGYYFSLQTRLYTRFRTPLISNTNTRIIAQGNLIQRSITGDSLAAKSRKRLGKRRTSLYRYYGEYQGQLGRLLYVGIAYDPKARWEQHCNDPSERWCPNDVDPALTEIEWYSSRPEAKAAETEAIRSEFPVYNKQERNDYERAASA